MKNLILSLVVLISGVLAFPLYAAQDNTVMQAEHPQSGLQARNDNDSIEGVEIQNGGVEVQAGNNNDNWKRDRRNYKRHHNRYHNTNVDRNNSGERAGDMR